MSKKHHGGPGPVPPDNRQHAGTSSTLGEAEKESGSLQKGGEVQSQQEHPGNQLGDYTGKGEHSIQQPGGKNGSDH
jgi:hypothetical protein